MPEADRPALPDIPFHAIVEQSVAGIYVIQDECFAYSNATWAALIGYTPAQLMGMHLSQVVPADFIDEVLARYHQRLVGDPPSMHFITRGLHRDGHVVLIEVHGSRMMYAGRPAVMGIGIDVTERLRNEEELHRSREQLQALTAYTSDKLEEQRLGLAREVHDVLGGMLTSIKMDVTRIQRRSDNTEVHVLAQGLLELTQQTIDTVKDISESLRPSVLDHLDLSVAIAQELRQFSRRSGVLHELQAEAPTLRLPPKRAVAVYRICQEALTNVARHARAGRVSARLDIVDDSLRFELRDDGQGYDTAAPAGRALGLLSMHERAREIGGQLRIESAPGQGTRLILDAPLL